MMHTPEISVVVPVYNGGTYLSGCLESIQAALGRLTSQDRAAIEVIVCDNHSTDESVAIARRVEFACPSSVVQPETHERNRTRNWAHGLAQARGEWLMMLHHDDLMAPDGLVGQLRESRSSCAKHAVLIVGRHRTFSEPSEPSGPRPAFSPPSLVSGPVLARSVLPLLCPIVPFALFRRSAYEAAGGLDDSWELVQDWELWLRLLSGGGDMLAHRGVTGWWRLHPTGNNYKVMNAREYLAFTRSLPARSIGVRPRMANAAYRAALDRAALQLNGVASDETVDVSWVAPHTLPSPRVARRRLRRDQLAISARLASLRLVGVIRRRLA